MLNLGTMMKSTVIVILILTFSQTMNAQRNNIKFTGLTKGQTSFGFERSINKNTSAVFSLIASNFDYGKQIFSPNFKYTNKGMRISGEYRLYLSKKDKNLNGLYMAPNASFGKHQLEYRRKPVGIGVQIFIGLFDFASDGEIDYPLDASDTKDVIGNMDVFANSLGLKLGYQKIWKRLTMDLGANFSKNSVGGGVKGFRLDNGGFESFKSDLSGNTTALYFGLGFSF